MTTDASGLKRGTMDASASIGALGDKINQTSSLSRGVWAAAVDGAGALAVGKMVAQASDLAEEIGAILGIR
ncbi:hypothetical protein [Paludisphaera borealis]|nr:hypothetical protein [Paludisphaera borealis]